MARSDKKNPGSGGRTGSRYQMLFENSAEPILIIEGEQFIDCNQAAVEMLGYADKAAVLSSHPSEISPEYQPDGQLSVEKANGILSRAARLPYQCFEWTHVKADGTKFPVEVSLTAIPNNETYMLHTTWRDISERKRLEEELRHSQKMDAVGKLAGGIAHDFNNQLVPIMGYAEMLGLALADDEKLSEWAAEIRRAAGFAAIMVDKLLALSRKDHQKIDVLDMDEAVTNLAGLLRQLIGEDIALNVRSANQPLWVKAARGDVEQILLNLASNSRDALPGGGEIRIDLSQVRDSGMELARLQFVDDGVGMDPDTLDRIYEPFFTTKEIGSGTGLGLSTVYEMVTKAGGRVEASSVPGQGTTFVVLIPITDSNAGKIAADTAHHTVRHEQADGVDQGHILVVDDNAQVGLFVAHVLGEQGFRVSVARNGLQALQMLDRETPDLILTDVIMDELGGPMMVRQLRDRGVDTPVVFMSGHPDDRLGAAGFDIANLNLLRKPFSSATLVELIRESLPHS